MTRSLVLVLCLAGCVGAPEPAGETSAALFANDHTAYDFFVQKGLTSFQSAGIVGNLDQESGVNPSSVQYGGGPGRGIAQWSVGGRWDTSANDNVLAYASKLGESSTSLNLQLEFIWYELNTFGYGFSQLEATTNVTDATVVFMDKYEICGTCDQTQRVSYAKAVLAAYGVTPEYSAAYVSQTWPLASQPALTVKCGERLNANIVLKNTGAKAWDSSTRLGTTQPRDRASLFAGADWISANRAATSGSVAPGADGKFAFAFDGPTGAACKPGTYHEFFGVVEEGVAWFSDSGQGGPPDNQIEALIDLVPGDPVPAPPDLGKPAEDLAPVNSSPPGDDGGGTPSAGDDGGLGRSTEAPLPSSDDPKMTSNVQGGCSAGGGADVSWAALMLLALAAVRTRRR